MTIQIGSTKFTRILSTKSLAYSTKTHPRQ